MPHDALTGGHAALMDEVYRRQRFIYDLTRKYYLFGRDKLIRELALAPGERLVEVGCGTVIQKQNCSASTPRRRC